MATHIYKTNMNYVVIQKQFAGLEEAPLEEMFGPMLVLPQAWLCLLHGSFMACTVFIQMPMLFCLMLHQTGIKPFQDGNLEQLYTKHNKTQKQLRS